jgi:hypothetical protein
MIKYGKTLAIGICALLSITLFACRKDISQMFNGKPNATGWARDYFNTTLLPNEGNQVSYNKLSSMASFGSAAKKPNMKTPVWDRATSGKTLLYEFVEVPLMFTRKIAPNIGKAGSPADMEVIKATFDRLIIYKNKAGHINQRIVTYIPEKEYLKRQKGDISHNKINRLDKDFQGHLVYKSWDGNILFILKISNGKVHRLSPPKAKKPLQIGKLQSVDRVVAERDGYEGEPGCTDWYYYEWEMTCYFSGDDPNPVYCDEPVITYEQWLYTTCPDDDPGEGGCGSPTNFDFGDCDPEIEPETPELDSLIKKFCDNMTQAQKTTIENAVDQLKDYDCATKYMYKHFDDTNKAFEFCISAGLGSGTYSPTTGGFNFTSNEAASNMYVMEHEFIHAYQDDIYPDGTEQYGLGPNGPSPGFVNIEFEQAVMNDLINYGNTTAFEFSGATQTQKDNYLLWIKDITNNGTTYPKLTPGGTPTEVAAYNAFMSSYNSFLTEFNALSGNPSHSTALNLSPFALIKLFNNINRNCQ